MVSPRRFYYDATLFPEIRIFLDADILGDKMRILAFLTLFLGFSR